MCQMRKQGENMPDNLRACYCPYGFTVKRNNILRCYPENTKKERIGRYNFFRIQLLQKIGDGCWIRDAVQDIKVPAQKTAVMQRPQMTVFQCCAPCS